MWAVVELAVSGVLVGLAVAAGWYGMLNVLTYARSAPPSASSWIDRNGEECESCGGLMLCASAEPSDLSRAALFVCEDCGAVEVDPPLEAGLCLEGEIGERDARL